MRSTFDEAIGASPASPPPGVGTIAFHYAYVTWTNAKVQLTIANETKRGEPDGVSTLLLTRQQLATIASDPDLTVTT